MEWEECTRLELSYFQFCGQPERLYLTLFKCIKNFDASKPKQGDRGRGEGRKPASRAPTFVSEHIAHFWTDANRSIDPHRIARSITLTPSSWPPRL